MSDGGVIYEAASLHTAHDGAASQPVNETPTVHSVTSCLRNTSKFPSI